MCSAPQILDATQGATSGVQPPVLRIDGPNVSLVAARQYVVSMQSTDGGVTFGPQVPISSGTYFTGAIGADGTVALGFGPRFTASRVGGALETRTVDLNPGFGSFQAVGFAGGRPVYVSGGRAPRTAVSHWKRQRGHLRPLDLDAAARARDGLLRPRQRPARAVAGP